MMIDPSRLLAGRRGLSRPEKEAILHAVLARVEPRPPRWRWRVATAAALVGAVAVAVVLLPGRPRDELTARGAALPAAFEVTCLPAPCAAGSKLAFAVTSTGDAAFLTVVARRGQTLIWYFPDTPDGRSVAIPPGGGVLDRGVVLGPEHAPGDYTIEGVFSREPLDRTAARAWLDRGGATVTRRMVVR